MYSRFKYVVGEVGIQTVAIVIPETLDHSSIKDVFAEGTITSAGFGSFDTDDVYVHGKSTGLGVMSNIERDTKLVGKAIAHPKYET